MMMSFRNLYYFLVVAEELSITRSAERLFISQQTLSEHIAKLEKEYNIKLFNRKRDISLTYAGKCMVDSVSRILAIEREMKNRFEDIRQEKGGEISIGLSVSRSQTLLPLAIPKFTQMYPNADLHVEIQSNSILKKHLFDGTVDIAVGFYDNFDTAQIHSIALPVERLCLAVPDRMLRLVFGENTQAMIPVLKAGADINHFASLPFLMIREGTWLRQKIDRLLYKNCILPNIKMELDTAEILCQLSSQGMGITFLAEQLIRNNEKLFDERGADTLHLFPICDPDTDCRLAIGYNRNQYLSSLAMSLIELLKIESVNLLRYIQQKYGFPENLQPYAQELGLSATDA
jgi:DNA-binding transcriptional LysR family regulator